MRQRSTRRSLPATVLFALLVGLCFNARGQESKEVSTQRLFWIGYLGTLRFNERWTMTLDAQQRRFVDPSAQHTSLLRSDVHRALGSGWDLAAGASVFFLATNDPMAPSGPVVPELRPHIEFNQSGQARKLRWSHRLRAEARYFHEVQGEELGEGFVFGNYRVRYRLGFDLPLRRSQDGTRDLLTLRLFDEVMLNLGRNIVRNTFDQNRIGVAVQAPLFRNVSAELGYIHWFQQRSSGTAYYERHIARFTIVQRIDLGGKKAPAAE